MVVSESAPAKLGSPLESADGGDLISHSEIDQELQVVIMDPSVELLGKLIKISHFIIIEATYLYIDVVYREWKFPICYIYFIEASESEKEPISDDNGILAIMYMFQSNILNFVLWFAY